VSEPGDRRAEIEAGLSAVRARIDRAMHAAGRRDEVRLVVVTKRFPATDVDLLADLGVLDVGENKDQEAGPKYAQVLARPRLHLHFIGQLQTNKAASVASYADVVHSVDRARLVHALARHRAPERPLDILLQVSLDGDPARGGVRADGLDELARLVAAEPALRLRGLMAVAPLGADPDEAFAGLRQLSHGIRQEHPAADWISAGMSADLEAAIRHGATHLRVGTAILGTRAPLG
jgi:pyridoxal phosphate enzyme (YggS family)